MGTGCYSVTKVLYGIYGGVKMTHIILAIIYLAFISLGLPDSMLGAAWPDMYAAFGVPLSYAGILSSIVSAGTIISSLLSDRLTLKFLLALMVVMHETLNKVTDYNPRVNTEKQTETSAGEEKFL